MSMKLADDFTFIPLPPISTPVTRKFAVVPDPLGPLAQLPGKWVGRGFNQIWRPFFANPNPTNQHHFLELNLTNETIQVDTISGEIPNRGLLQEDIIMFGVSYLQQITDANVGAGLHFEPGIWLTVPETTNPEEPQTVCRLASIPHGTSVLAQGEALEVPGGPQFDPVVITPFAIGDPGQKFPFPESDLSIPTPFRSPPAQIVGITQGMVDDPNSVLQAAIAGQTITQMVVLTVSSDPNGPIAGGGTANTAFLQGTPPPPTNANAQASLVTATFWIETVQGQGGEPDFLQLQYTQTVLLDFGGLSWPHVSVGTLRQTVSNRPSQDEVDPPISKKILTAMEPAAR